MFRALEIALNGLGSTAPNPMVGAVIVHNDTIIGEGFTSAYGGTHAEVNAIASVSEKAMLRHATLYVTLEPCSHFGKTPPCADLIIEKKIPIVVVGLLDPHEKVAGKGIEKLREAGINVKTGVLEAECRKHHKRFLTFHVKKRPYMVLKWAQSADGFIAPEDTQRTAESEPFWISNSYSRQITHQWRSDEQAILVGTTTVLKDNPKLDVRQWTGKNPVRIILDRSLKITKDFHVLDGSVPTVVLTEVSDAALYLEHIDYRILDFSKDVATETCKILYNLNITSVLIEGGAKTLQTFIETGLWDEARVFTGNSQIKEGIRAPEPTGSPRVSKNIGSDNLKIFNHD